MSTTYRTNIVTTKDKKLIMGMNNSLFESIVNINQWDDAPKDLYQWTGAASNFNIQTKDIDFGDPSRRKKIYRVYVTFKAGGYMSGVIAKYAVNGSNSFTGTFNDTTYYNNKKGFDSWNGSTSNSSADWITVGLKPTTTLSTTKIKSLQLKFEFANAGRYGYNIVQGAGYEFGGDTVNLDANANADVNGSGVRGDDYYNGMPFYIFAGNGAGSTYRIENYIGTNQVVTFDSVEDDSLTDDDETVTALNPITSTAYYDIGFIPKEFAINDISIVYRNKPIK